MTAGEPLKTSVRAESTFLPSYPSPPTQISPIQPSSTTRTIMHSSTHTDPTKPTVGERVEGLVHGVRFHLIALPSLRLASGPSARLTPIS